MMYGLIGREMGLFERTLINAGHAINLISSGTFDSAETIESIIARGFDLFNGVALDQMKTRRFEKMHQPERMGGISWSGHRTKRQATLYNE